MSVRSARLALLLTLAAVYGTLSGARVVTEWLREQNLLRVAVGLGFAGALAGMVGALQGARARPGFYPALLAVILVYTLVLAGVESPEERLHLLEYGLVGLLARRSLSGSLAAAPVRGVLVAVLLTLFAGWLDEGLQGLLPTRHYDPRDVVLNTLAAALALASEALFGWVARRERPPSPPRIHARSNTTP